ncbi:hypothetical protein LMTR13_25470 [Bradyrhizobium icense]|uniref:Uncharacterized protein n=1 Tax=Bradyrhizobium icense TaxID=1274631 RepID=A0A1B1UJT9_9BRAD|nr:hypothetical protein LMTR13_25470 [Bradyrhizobium icense]
MDDLAKAGQEHPSFISDEILRHRTQQARYEILMSAGGIEALEWESERSRGGARPRAWLRTKANLSACWSWRDCTRSCPVRSALARIRLR